MGDSSKPILLTITGGHDLLLQVIYGAILVVHHTSDFHDRLNFGELGHKEIFIPNRFNLMSESPAHRSRRCGGRGANEQQLT